MYTIRKGTLADAAQMASIFNHYIAHSEVIFSERLRTADDMEQQIRPVIDGGYPFLVAEEEGRLCGYCFAHAWLPDPVYARSWELTEYLSHDATGRGVGTDLLRRVIDACRNPRTIPGQSSVQPGAHTLVAFVTASNAPCCNMLARLGFNHVGTLPQTGWKFGRWYDDAVFQLIFPE